MGGGGGIACAARLNFDYMCVGVRRCAYSVFPGDSSWVGTVTGTRAGWVSCSSSMEGVNSSSDEEGCALRGE